MKRAVPAISPLEGALLFGIRGGIVLLLLTPFVISQGTVYPFIVGKALYSRALIEVVFGLWLLLASMNPAFRPPRSWLLILMAVGLAWAAVAAGFGVSPQRSLWSNYERMAGLVDAAHWFALVVVAASALRSPRELRQLLGPNLAVSVGVALLAVASYFQVDPIVYGVILERSYPRIGTVFGNAGYLGTYALVNFVIALGFLAQSGFASRSKTPPSLKRRPGMRWALRVLLALVAALEFWALSLSGSLAAAAGLLGAGAFVAVGLAVRKLAPKVWIGGAIAAILFTGFAGSLVLFQQSERSMDSLATADNPLLQRMTLQEGVRTYRARESAWQAAVDAFPERLWLGWGPENYIVAFGRHAAGLPAEGEVHDRAHNELLEKAVAEGLPGLVATLALWAFVFCVVVRAANAQASRDRVFALFVGAALAGYFVANQFQADTSALRLQLAWLLAFAVGLEVATAERRAPAVRSASAPLHQWALAIAAAVGGTLLVAGGLAANHAIYTAATAFLTTQRDDPAYIERTIAAFPPLATEPRMNLFNRVAHDWERSRLQDEASAKQLLSHADAQARAAVAAEPENWRLRRAVAGMYLAVATTEPDYAPLAERHVKRALELAPNLP